MNKMQSIQVDTSATVLIVEDDQHLNAALVETLQIYGYTTLSAHNGREALEIMRAHLPNVIVCDITMPVMDGYTFLQHTRDAPEWRLLPFIFLTARSTTEDQRRAKAIGIEDYLNKPIDARDLVAAIENALKRRRLMIAEIERNMDNLRNRIVGLLQHEFRTPLTFILGYAELLLGSEGDNLGIDEMRLAAGAILEGGRRLQQQIESLLFLAELQDYSFAPNAIESINAWLLLNDTLRSIAASESPSELPVRLCDQNNGVVMVKVDVRLIDEAIHQIYNYVQRVRRVDATSIECCVEHRFPFVGLMIRCDSVALLPMPPTDPLGRTNLGATPMSETDMDLGLTLALNVARLHGGKLEIAHGEGHTAAFTLWLPGAGN